MGKVLSWLGWLIVAIIGASAFAWLALSRGERVSAAWLVTAAVCTYLIAYRFYSRFIASKIFALDANRTTPAERLNDGRDYVPTNRCHSTRATAPKRVGCVRDFLAARVHVEEPAPARARPRPWRE